VVGVKFYIFVQQRHVFQLFCRTMSCRTANILDRVLQITGENQAGIRKHFPKYKPSEELLEVDLSQLMHQELNTVLLHRFTRRSFHHRTTENVRLL